MADEFTPTDNEVRSMFCIGISDPTNPKPVPARQAYDGYDRWLASVKADAWDEGQKSGARWGGPPLDAYEEDPPSNNPHRQTR